MHRGLVISASHCKRGRERGKTGRSPETRVRVQKQPQECGYNFSPLHKSKYGYLLVDKVDKDGFYKNEVGRRVNYQYE